MNLHGIVAPLIGAVNPMTPCTIRVSTGAAENADGTVTPGYATPGAFTASIGDADGVLTVTALASGTIEPGQTIAGVAVLSGTEIVAQLTGTEGGIGTYQLNRPHALVASEAMTAAFTMLAQVQPMTWRDLQQVDGLNMNGTRRKIYLYGSVDSVNRVTSGGGDIITIAAGGPNDGVFLVAQVLEQFPDWCSVAATLQNEG